MHNPTLIKTLIADGDISGDRLIVLKGDGYVSQADDTAQHILGATDRLGARPGDRIDVILQGIAEVQAGETITAPAVVTANAQGQAVVAASGNASAGLAITSASAGEVVSVLLGYYTPAAAQSNAVDNENNEPQNGGNEQNNDEPQATTVTDETVTYNVEAAAFILAHYPVVEGSLTVKSADGETTYTLNTDYAVTLAEGKITSVENTTMTFAENATIKCSYQYTAA